MFELELLTALFAVAHAAGATAVTVHALLRKDDVRAAIGWIGVSWLSPLIGSMLYYAMGVNRIARRGARLNRNMKRRKAVVRACDAAARSGLADNIAVIARAGDRLGDYPLAEGNRLAVLQSGDEAYPAMLQAIRAARRSVALSSYIFRGEGVGRTFIEALAEAQARGVEVRVLVDGIGGGYWRAPAVRGLARAGVPAARFLHHWMPWRMPFLNMRSHKKILVADGRLGFTGGINIGDENLLASNPPAPVEDLHFLVEGPVVEQLMLTFAEDWFFTTGEILEGDAWWPALAPAGQVTARGISSGPDEDMGNMETVLTTALGAARTRVRIVTPYFLPDRPLISAIRNASVRGVEVDVVFPEHSDHLVVEWATQAHLRFFGAPDVRLHLVPSFDHTKLVTVDGKWGLIGTPNWDVRSMRLNFEFGLECYNEPTVAEMDRLIDEKIARARLSTPEEFARRPIPLRLRDSAARLLLPYL